MQEQIRKSNHIITPWKELKLDCTLDSYEIMKR